MDYKDYLIKALEKEIAPYKDKEKEKRIMYIAGFLSCMENLESMKQNKNEQNIS